MPAPEIVVPPSAAHPQDWLRPQLRLNPKPGFQTTTATTLAEFAAPETVSKIVVDQYAGDPEEVRRYLTRMPGARAEYFAPSLALCANTARLVWTSTSTITFESGRTAKLAVATVVATKGPPSADTTGCLGLDKVPVDSLYVSYLDPEGYRWFFTVPLKRP